METRLRAPRTRRAPGAGGELGRWREAEETEGVATDEFQNIGWSETKGFQEAAGVTREVEGEVSGARRGDAGEGEILQEDAKLFVVGDVGGRWPSFAPNLADSGGASSFVPLVRDLAPSDLPPTILGTRSAMG